jgi:hypothetical protein
VIASLAALIASVAVAGGSGSASTARFARALEVISSASRGDTRTWASVPIVIPNGRRATTANFVEYVRTCELDRFEDRGSVLSASLLCRVRKLQGIEVKGGAKLLESRPLQFIFGGSRNLIRIALGDRDPLAPKVNVLPREPR